MEDERSLARKDYILKKLASECDFIGEVYSSDEELDLPFETNDISDDIDEIVCREQIRGAKNFFQEVVDLDDDDDDDDNDDADGNDDFNDIVDAFLEAEGGPIEDNLILKPAAKHADVLSYLETAMERNSKMRDMLLAIEQSLLKRKQEFEDMICALQDDDTTSEPVPSEDDEIIASGFPGFMDGVIFTNKSKLFINKFTPQYFKDKEKFYCPPNRHTLEQEKHQIKRLADIRPSLHWTSQFIDQLETAIKNSLIDEFKNRSDFKAIYKWREYSSFVKKHSLAEVMAAKPPDYKLDWLKIATMLPPQNSQTSTECSKLWDLYLSPKFNKEEWTQDEDEKIISLATKYDEQDWDEIANELGTNRSAFQVFSYYQSHLRYRLHMGKKWTVEEDEYIKKVITSCTYGNFISWKKVMYYCEKRSYTQVYNRWLNNLACKKKGKFSLKEDCALVSALAHGIGFKDTAKVLGGQRTPQQIRERLMGIVKFGRDNALNIGDWSTAEDNKLLNLIKKHGENYSAIAKEIGTRDRTQCRHRYVRLKKYLQNPDFDFRNLERKRQKTKYSYKMRCRKRTLMKFLGPGKFSHRKKKILVDQETFLDDEDESAFCLPQGARAPNVARKFNPILKYLSNNGSKIWTVFDSCKANETEIDLISDCCKVLKCEFNYDNDSYKNDEHYNPIQTLIPLFEENDLCSATDSQSSVFDDGPSTSSGSYSSKLPLLPPNSYNCSGFFNSLSYCTEREKYKNTCKSSSVEETSEDVLKAKELFQQRLVQLFFWPAILSQKNRKNRYVTFGNKAIKFKMPESLQKQ